MGPPIVFVLLKPRRIGRVSSDSLSQASRLLKPNKAPVVRPGAPRNLLVVLHIAGYDNEERTHASVPQVRVSE